MIEIDLGNVGSGKTLSQVRDMALNIDGKKTYTNIRTDLPNQIDIKADMIVKKEKVGEVKKRSGEIEDKYSLSMNVDFWRGIKESINVVIDEAHTILNARRSMSKFNIIVTDWIALLRRVIGGADQSMGKLVFISQLPNRIDNIAREMCNLIKYHLCHYRKVCGGCGLSWREHNEMHDILPVCPRCSSRELEKRDHVIQVWCFSSMSRFHEWRILGHKSYYRTYYIMDAEKYFPLYDTLQWDNMFSEH